MDFQEKIMVGSLIFLGLSAFYYIWLWVSGFLRDSRSAESPKQPWE